MMTGNSQFTGAAPTAWVNDDLAEVHGAVRLAEMASKAVLTTLTPVPSPAASGRRPDPSSALAAIYTYSLARGWYGAEEISGRLLSDGCLRYLARGLEADALTLRSFRRSHAPLLRRTLSQLLETGLEPGTGVDFRAEAVRRLQAAVESDSLALDV